ncbi:hypothetical protein [Actinotalea sp. JY-7885]|uniref:hypothetical protein n=1 Tax=Actinotalea sp. JY-7885 TaxID=2758576 RepID=UPI00165DEAD8|nr:hypothetical protein [Actinotalea sp. JY-7885]
MTLDEVCRIVLFQAIEEDASLWQILWELNHKFPDAVPQRRRLMAARVVSTLAHEALITIAWSTWDAQDRRLVPDEEIDAVVADDRFWRPAGPGDVGLAINITEVGEAHYFGPSRGAWVFEAGT